MTDKVLRLVRVEKADTFTIGELYLPGESLRFCWVCEDKVRAPGIKVPGETAIPFGTYEIAVTMSRRFGVLMPILLNVPMFEGIRIHAGNWAVDTEGCLLPGLIRLRNGVSHSKDAYSLLFRKINDWLNAGDKVYIQIT